MGGRAGPSDGFWIRASRPIFVTGLLSHVAVTTDLEALKTSLVSDYPRPPLENENEWMEDISATLICTVVRVRGRHTERTENRNTGNAVFIGSYYYSVLYMCVRFLPLAQAVFSFQNSFFPLFASIKI